MIENRLIIFLGSDISSHLLLNNLLPKIEKLNIQSTIYCPLHRGSSKANLPELRRLNFYERTIWEEFLYPYLNINNIQIKNHTLKQLKDIYKIKIENIEKVNHQKIITELISKNMIGGISIRCYQKFSPQFIDIMKNHRKILWNLHPGKLPEYQGVSTIIREMANNEKTSGLTLHEIEEDYDTGAIIDQRNYELNYNLSVFKNISNIYPLGYDLIARNLEKLLNEKPILKTKQPKEKQKYYSYPNKEDLKKYKENGLQLVNEEDIKTIISKCYGISNNMKIFWKEWNLLVEKFEEYNENGA